MLVLYRCPNPKNILLFLFVDFVALLCFACLVMISLQYVESVGIIFTDTAYESVECPSRHLHAAATGLLLSTAPAGY